MIVRREEQIAWIAQKVHDNDYTIVLTGGVFDWLHHGHIRSFQEALAYPALHDDERETILFVAVNEDISAEHFKREPALTQEHRAFILDSIHIVDVVVLFPASNPANIIRLIEPDYYLKGEEYKLEDLPERQALESCRTVYIPCKKRITVSSTTELIKRGARNA